MLILVEWTPSQEDQRLISTAVVRLMLRIAKQELIMKRRKYLESVAAHPDDTER